MDKWWLTDTVTTILRGQLSQFLKSCSFHLFDKWLQVFSMCQRIRYKLGRHVLDTRSAKKSTHTLQWFILSQTRSDFSTKWNNSVVTISFSNHCNSNNAYLITPSADVRTMTAVNSRLVIFKVKGRLKLLVTMFTCESLYQVLQRHP